MIAGEKIQIAVNYLFISSVYCSQATVQFQRLLRPGRECIRPTSFTQSGGTRKPEVE